MVFAFVTGMCLVVGRCVPVGETRTLTVNSAGESQRANLEPPSGCLLDGLGRTHCAPPAQQLRFRFTFNRRRGGERAAAGGKGLRGGSQNTCGGTTITTTTRSSTSTSLGCGKSFKVDEPSSGPSLKRSRLHYSWGDQID